MIKMYTSLGRFEMRRSETGNQYPVVMLHGKEHLLEIRDMIVWSTLMWAIHTENELQDICGVKAREAELPGISCADCLTRLEGRGLVVSGCDYVGLDSMYNLIENLNIVPVNEGIGTKILAFLHLTFIKGVPFRQTKKDIRNRQADRRRKDGAGNHTAFSVHRGGTNTVFSGKQIPGE